MKSELPKVAVQVHGRPMLLHVLDHLVAADINRIVIVVGYKKEEVQALVPGYPGVQIEYAIQDQQLGTAHAVLSAEPNLEGFQGSVLVACGDMPLIRKETFRSLLDQHEKNHNRVTVLSAELENPTGYGRLVREDGKLIRIVEEKDATEEIRRIRETNTGTYVFQAPEIFQVLKGIDTDNVQKEYYLPDAVEIFQKQREPVGSVVLEDPVEALGANSKGDVDFIESRMEINT